MRAPAGGDAGAAAAPVADAVMPVVKRARTLAARIADFHRGFMRSPVHSLIRLSIRSPERAAGDDV
ncbi:hypothetical protein GCM10012284_04030 [Mangrovihabitans endophyticus]|uniref:Uncharacterized protein n=1 Tax=Mangrovihabitans endophyticus TaxID=1751298 RepID=A0A8J3BVL8_9ACTN|nr:hypothetical protein GCM10012284_04030 [Mangrovihabitans endophyticus]